MPNNHEKTHFSKFKASVGLAAVAAAAAGAYYFYGSKKSARHRKALKAWTIKARGEIIEKLEQMREVSQQTYEKAVSDVMNKYKRLKTVSPKELAALAKELKNHWRNISKELSKSKKKRI